MEHVAGYKNLRQLLIKVVDAGVLGMGNCAKVESCLRSRAWIRPKDTASVC